MNASKAFGASVGGAIGGVIAIFAADPQFIDHATALLVDSENESATYVVRTLLYAGIIALSAILPATTAYTAPANRAKP